MKEKWIIEPETESTGTEPVWAAVHGETGRRTAAAVVSLESDATVRVLTEGMFYLSGPGTAGSVLFRITGSRRAYRGGCMFINAVEAANPVRSQENALLRQMHRILDMGMIISEPAESYQSAAS